MLRGTTLLCGKSIRLLSSASSEQSVRSVQFITAQYHKSNYKVDIPNMSLTEFLGVGFNKDVNRKALIDGSTGKSTTFGQLQEEIYTVTSRLSHLFGLKHGQVVCLCGLNAPEFAHVICAVTSLRASLTIANAQLTAGELLSQVKETQASVLIVTPDCAEKGLMVKQACSTVKEVIVIGRHKDCVPFIELLAPSSHITLPHVDPQSDVALIPYSSGTTGLPKGVQLTHRNIIADILAMGHEQFIPFDESSGGSLSVLPMVHVAGMVIGMLNPLSQGATVVTLPRFQPEQFLQALQRYKTTFSLIAPPIMNFLAKDPLVDQYDLSSWSMPFSGAAPLSLELTQTVIQRLGLQGIKQGYGMSESSPATHMCPTDSLKYGSIGVPIPNTESKVVDVNTGASLGMKASGEIWVRGPQVMKGYLNNPTATSNTITHDGWLKTGDIGYFDEDGHYFVVDRLKEIIKYKGYQIAPAYLESVLLSYETIIDAAVIGTAHEIHGHLPTAYVVCSQPTNPEKIAQFVNGQVAPYKQLRGGINIVKEIPRLPSGKILRRKLQAL